MADRLAQLTAAGVAIWLDDLSRARLATESARSTPSRPDPPSTGASSSASSS